MKIFQCDKCKKKFKENFDLLKLDIQNGNVTQDFDFMNTQKLPDICKACAAEFEKLKLEIMKENAKKIKEWWDK